jgi:hypothetical protein
MTSTWRAGITSREELRLQTRRAGGAVRIPMFFVSAFAIWIIGTDHKPRHAGVHQPVGPPRVADHDRDLAPLTKSPKVVAVLSP